MRTRFPTGMVFTILTGAALGSTVCRIVLTDFHGHAVTQYAIFAATGAILAAVAWAFDKPLAARANLDTPPFFRLEVALGIALVTSAYAVGAYVEFTAGSGNAAETAFATFLCVVTGIIPLLSAASLAVGFEAGLHALRRGVKIASALHPVRRELTAGVVFAVIVGYVVWYDHIQTVIAVVSATPDEVRTSHWLENEKSVFAAALRGANCEVLIVPFEAADRSVDRPARSLMTRMVAAELSDRGVACVADPTLVSRALGTTARRYDTHSIFRLAESLGAQSIVRGEVARSIKGQNFELTISRYSTQSAGRRWREDSAVVWGPMPFSDQLPPEVSFRSILYDVVDNLGVARAPASAPAASLVATRDRSDLPAQFASEPSSPMVRAKRLQLLAATYADADVNGEQLWERSLIALRSLSQQDEAAQVLRALAVLHLYRRPYAVELMRGVSSDAARNVLALIQGNLTQAEAEATQAAVGKTDLAIVMRLESERIRMHYYLTDGYQARRDALLDAHPDLAAWLYVPMSSAEWFQPAAHELIRRQLVQMGVTVPEDPFTQAARYVAAHFGNELFFRNDYARLPVAIERSYGPLWRAHAVEWNRSLAFDRPAPWDAFDSLYAGNRASLINSGWSVCGRQSLPAACLDFVESLGVEFRGHPALGASIVRALYEMRLANTTLDPVLDERHRRLAYDIARWEGGETETAYHVAWAAGPHGPPPWIDEPPRPWRALPESANSKSGMRRISSEEQEQNIAAALRSLDYSQYDGDFVERAWALLRKAGGEQRSDRLLDATKNRFDGNVTHENFLIDIAAEKDDLRTFIGMLQQKRNERPERWNLYPRLAEAQLRARDLDSARATLRSFPLFDDAQANRVDLSNKAEEGATLLRRAGETEAAREFYERAITYETGSGAEMESQMRLAQFDADWGAAIDWDQRLYRRYNSAWGLSRSTKLLFMTGRADEGWRAFDAGSHQFNDTRAWDAATCGHRMSSTSPEYLLKFAERWRPLTVSDAEARALRTNFLFNSLLIDREPDDERLGAVVRLANGGGGYFSSFAPGYIAWKRGEYAESVSKLADMHATLTEQPATASLAVKAALPYVALGLAQTGRQDEASRLVTNYRDKIARDFFYLLAEASVQASAGKSDIAHDLLWEAFFVRPLSIDTTLRPDFQLLEICERLFLMTKDDRLRAMLVDFAQRMQKSWPDSWAFAFEATYGKDVARREKATALALYLDPQSEHLARVSALERKHATQWLEKNNPFTK